MDKGKTKGTVTQTYYRGYVIAHDEVGADIWFGGDFISSEPNFNRAKAVVDEWLDAP